jgi:hypothetical protein
MDYESVVEATNEIIEEYDVRLTVRQLYYRLVSPPYQLFPNNRNCYTGFDKILTKAREKGDVDWKKIEDRARSTLGVACRLVGKQIHAISGMSDFEYSWASHEEFLNAMIDELKNCDKDFVIPMWENQPNYVEVWVEKDALASLFSALARGYRVVTFPSRGYSSFTKVMEAIEDRFMERAKQGQHIIVLHFTDHDPSGLDMTYDLQNRLATYFQHALANLAVEDEKTFLAIGKRCESTKTKIFNLYRCALTHDQVKQFGLASNPTKMADPRSKDYVAEYGNECWELDALPPTELRRIIQDSIARVTDLKLWAKRSKQLESEREKLKEKLRKLKISFD